MSWFYGSLEKEERRVKRDLVAVGREERSEWRRWKQTHDISGLDAQEEEIRLQEFVKRRRWVEARNKELEKAGASYRVGLNILSALTDKEASTLTGSLETMNDEEINRVRNDSGHRTLLESYMKKTESDSVKPWSKVQTLGADFLPLSIDWRKYGAVTDIKSQGKCGACWAFAATGAMEGLMYIKHGKLISLSENQLLECDADEFQKACKGGNFFYSFKYMSSNPVATSRSYPYSYSNQDGEASACQRRSGVVDAVIGSTANNGVLFIDVSESALKEAVSKQPVAVAIHGYAQDFKNYKEGVLDTPDCTDAVDHAALVVGYGTTSEGKDYWLVRNQWGQGWGDRGYIKIARNTGVKNGMCGILVQANIPTGVDCAIADCSPLESPQFCTTEIGCINSTADYRSDDWFVPASTFMTINRNIGAESLNAALIVLAVILSLGIAFIIFYIARVRYRILKHFKAPLSFHNFFVRRFDTPEHANLAQSDKMSPTQGSSSLNPFRGRDIRIGNDLREVFEKVKVLQKVVRNRLSRDARTNGPGDKENQSAELDRHGRGEEEAREEQQEGKERDLETGDSTDRYNESTCPHAAVEDWDFERESQRSPPSRQAVDPAARLSMAARSVRKSLAHMVPRTPRKTPTEAKNSTLGMFAVDLESDEFEMSMDGLERSTPPATTTSEFARTRSKFLTPVTANSSKQALQRASTRRPTTKKKPLSSLESDSSTEMVNTSTGKQEEQNTQDKEAGKSTRDQQDSSPKKPSSRMEEKLKAKLNKGKEEKPKRRSIHSLELSMEDIDHPEKDLHMDVRINLERERMERRKAEKERKAKNKSLMRVGSMLNPKSEQ